MSEVKPIPVWQADAEWSDEELVVRASDYDALRAECERLRDENGHLHMENSGWLGRLDRVEAENYTLAEELAALKAVPDGVVVVAHLYLGYFGPEELGEIDIDLVSPTAERLQQELVRGEDVTLSLMTVAQHNAIVAALHQPVAGQDVSALVEAIEEVFAAREALADFERENPGNTTKRWEACLCRIEAAEDALQAALATSTGQGVGK